MRALIFAAGAALTLAACGGGTETTANEDANAMAADNMMMDENLMLDQNAMTADGAGGLDGNASTNGTTENMMMNDLTTNDADTNLANGM